MVSLGVVLLITDANGSYALAGAMSAAFALATAFISPFGARWVDRSGQTKVLPILAVVESIFLVLFTLAATHGYPVALQFGLVVLAGASSPNIGSTVRARWANMLTGGPGLRSAFALEAVVDELVFVVGPPLVTTLAVKFGPPQALFVCVVLILSGSFWLAALRSTQPQPRPKDHSEARSGFINAGFVIVTSLLLLMGGIFGAFEVTTVAFTTELGHEGITGLVLAVYAFGSLLSGLLVGARSSTTGMPQQLLIATIVLAVVTLPLPFVSALGPLIAAAFFAGLAVSPVLILTLTIVQSLVPPPRLTEALTIATGGVTVGFAMAATGSGALVDTMGAHAGYYLMAGCAVLALIVATATWKTLKKY